MISGKQVTLKSTHIPKEISKRDRILVVVLTVVLFTIIARPFIAYLSQWRAEQYLINGQNEQAAKSYRKAILLEPNNSSAHSLLGYAYSRMGQKEKATSEYKKAIKLGSQDPQLYLELGQTLFQQGKYKQAILNFKKAIKFDPEFLSAYRMLATSYERAGDVKGAISVWQQMKEKFGLSKEADRKIEELHEQLTLTIGE